jgi:hypothetical protein
VLYSDGDVKFKLRPDLLNKLYVGPLETTTGRKPDLYAIFNGTHTKIFSKCMHLAGSTSLMDIGVLNNFFFTVFGRVIKVDKIDYRIFDKNVLIHGVK